MPNRISLPVRASCKVPTFFKDVLNTYLLVKIREISTPRMGQMGSKPEEVYQLLDQIPLTATQTGEIH